MKNCKSVICHWAVCTLLALGGCTSHQIEKAQKMDEQAVGQIIEHYVESINRCDTVLFRHIWAESNEVSFIAPSGYYTSYQEIKDSLLIGIFGQKFKSRNLQKEHIKIHINERNAWSEFFWTFNAIKKDGTLHDTKGHETQIFKKDNDGLWKLVHIHYSTLKNN